MTTAYFDCFSGAGGDMIVAALVDAGADVDSLRRGFDSLGLEGYDLSIGPVTKQGFAATRFVVTSEKDRPQPHRHLSDIAGIIGAADLPDPVKTRSMRVFERLAEAEAAVHGRDVARIHFHEVGAVDSILDVVGAVLAMHLLAVDRVICSPLPVGSGTVVCEHGTLPVPAPATANLLKGVPLAACDETGELVTPTAAAVLTTVAEAFAPLPAMVVAKIGYGAGSRDGLHRPNLLRVLIGDESPAGDVDEITILETNLDDVSPQVVGHCIEVLLAAGALDVYAVPIQMKKSRPGLLLTVLCDGPRADALERLLFAETPTFGIRRHRATRAKLHRRHETVTTPYGPVRIKVGERSGVTTATPEFDDCKAAADRHRVAIREVIAVADAAWATMKSPTQAGER